MLCVHKSRTLIDKQPAAETAWHSDNFICMFFFSFLACLRCMGGVKVWVRIWAWVGVGVHWCVSEGRKEVEVWRKRCNVVLLNILIGLIFCF
jgi:hypothetical protein